MSCDNSNIDPEIAIQSGYLKLITNSFADPSFQNVTVPLLGAGGVGYLFQDSAGNYHLYTFGYVPIMYSLTHYCRVNVYLRVWVVQYGSPPVPYLLVDLPITLTNTNGQLAGINIPAHYILAGMLAVNLPAGTNPQNNDGTYIETQNISVQTPPTGGSYIQIYAQAVQNVQVPGTPTTAQGAIAPFIITLGYTENVASLVQNGTIQLTTGSNPNSIPSATNYTAVMTFPYNYLPVAGGYTYPAEIPIKFSSMLFVYGTLSTPPPGLFNIGAGVNAQVEGTAVVVDYDVSSLIPKNVSAITTALSPSFVFSNGTVSFTGISTTNYTYLPALLPANQTNNLLALMNTLFYFSQYPTSALNRKVTIYTVANGLTYTYTQAFNAEFNVLPNAGTANGVTQILYPSLSSMNPATDTSPIAVAHNLNAPSVLSPLAFDSGDITILQDYPTASQYTSLYGYCYNQAVAQTGAFWWKSTSIINECIPNGVNQPQPNKDIWSIVLDVGIPIAIAVGTTILAVITEGALSPLAIGADEAAATELGLTASATEQEVAQATLADLQEVTSTTPVAEEDIGALGQVRNILNKPDITENAVMPKTTGVDCTTVPGECIATYEDPVQQIPQQEVVVPNIAKNTNTQVAVNTSIARTGGFWNLVAKLANIASVISVPLTALYTFITIWKALFGTPITPFINVTSPQGQTNALASGMSALQQFLISLVSGVSSATSVLQSIGQGVISTMSTILTALPVAFATAYLIKDVLTSMFDKTVDSFTKPTFKLEVPQPFQVQGYKTPIDLKTSKYIDFKNNRVTYKTHGNIGTKRKRGLL
jgi:hypothetical protein